MFNIKVERVINKPINEVFGYLSDHANYQQFKGIDASKLLEEGDSHKNGLGALREIIAGGATLHEKIVKFEPPTCLGYLITYSRPLPYKHSLGEITLTETEAGTQVSWVSQGTITTPLLGKWYFDKQIQKHGSRAFGSILKQIAAA